MASAGARMSQEWEFVLKLIVGENVVHIVSHTRATVLIDIDPTLPWDHDALMKLTAALECVAKRLSPPTYNGGPPTLG